MTDDHFLASQTDLEKLVDVKAELDDWTKANPGVLFKAGGKKKRSNRHRDATHYDRRYYDRASAYIFSGNLIDSRQAAWLELMLIKYAYSLGLGVNDNRGSARNMATLPGSPYNDAKPGCLYLVPVVATITTQPQYFAVHQSHHCRVKQLIAGGSYVKGKKKPGYKHTKKRRPHKRGPYNKSKPYKKRKPHAPGSRGPYKKQGPSKRKKGTGLWTCK
jgi:hypothetical protein